MLCATLLASSSFVSEITLHDKPVACARNKTLHLIRHAEGWHNVDELEAEAAFTSGAAEWHGIDLKDPSNVALRKEYGIAWTLLERVTGTKYHDPHLTPKGRDQCTALRTQLRADPTFVTSLQLRCLLTTCKPQIAQWHEAHVQHRHRIRDGRRVTALT